MKNRRRNAVQGLWKNQLSHEYQQDKYSEIGIDKILQTGQKKDDSCIERKIEIMYLFHPDV